MAAELLPRSITPRTKAVIPVHIYGHPARIDKIAAIARDHSLYLVEDCAQAHGATYKGRRVGSFGDMGCFSFYPTKNLSAIGDGGMVVTNNEELARKAMRLREYGWAERLISHEAGWNTRLDELQAAILRVKLKYLDQDNRARAKLADLYHLGLNDMPLTLPSAEKGSTHVYHLFVIKTRERDRLLGFLKDRDIGAAIHYPAPVHLQPAYTYLGNKLPQTEKTAKEILTLPMYPELAEDAVKTVVDAVREFVND
jgi:dTDP-4-amino-4,6-dideoxygalactose transaminase